MAAVAMVATAGARFSLAPFSAPRSFITLFPGVVFAAWYGGSRAGYFATVLRAAVVLNLFIEHGGGFIPANPNDLFAEFVFVAMGGVIRLLVGRGEESWRAIGSEREKLAVTLGSIGHVVIVTDPAGRVTYLNPDTGWTRAEAEGRPLDQVFRVVNESTRLPVGSPAEEAMASGHTVGRPGHTLLLARDGREVPIDDSSAPVRGAGGKSSPS